MKKNTILWVLIIFTLLVIDFVVFFYLGYKSKKETESSGVKLTLDQGKVDTHLSKILDTAGVYWQRMFQLYWNDAEREKGKIDWDFFDEQIEMLNENEIYSIGTIMPYANWDQDACHGEEYEASFDPEKGGDMKVGKPCDMEAYSNFLQKLVERYDGDGVSDMPGLTIPIKYWEIMNEPSMQGGVTGGMGEDLKFFKGTSQEYFDILKKSYEVIKQADPEAKVLHGGMAGMHQKFVDFWTPVFELGAGDYFDIANIHAISVEDHMEDLYVIKFKEFLKSFGIEDKPIWLTEDQIGSLTKKPATDEALKDFEILLVKSSVFSLAQGADKLFYIENWVTWDASTSSAQVDDNEIKGLDVDPKEDDLVSKKDFSTPESVLGSSTHKVYLNLVDKINNFDSIEAIKEDYTEHEEDFKGATSTIGQYKFVNGDDEVYVLWGVADVPDEITGDITVTDIYGESKLYDSANLKLTEEPVFVEK